MRIAWVSYDFGEFCIPQVRALAASNEVFLALAVRTGTPHVICPGGLLDPFLFDRPRLRQPVRQIRAVVQVLHRLRQFRPDIIHLQAGHLWFNLTLPFIRSVPLVVTIHDPRYHAGDAESRRTPQVVMFYGYRRAERVIVHGRSLVQVVHDVVGTPINRIHVVPLVAIGDPHVMNHSDDENPNEVLFFGRIWSYKGLEYLIRAEPLISRELPDVRITIAGAGEDFERYRRMMQRPDRFDVRNRWISEEERRELFQRAAVVILPYTSATQSGIVQLAYLFAKPVIATTVGALPDSIDDGVTGLLVPPSDEASLARAIITLLRDAPLRRRMGEAGRRKVTTEWSPPEVARRTMEVYNEAIRDYRARQRRRRRASD